MKQHLNQTDILSLSEEQRRKLQEWWKPEIGDKYIGYWSVDGYQEGILEENEDGSLYLPGGVWLLPRLSIGQLIQFLDEHNDDWWHLAYQDVGFVDDTVLRRTKDIEFIDALFEAVKELL